MMMTEVTDDIIASAEYQASTANIKICAFGLVLGGNNNHQFLVSTL